MNKRLSIIIPHYNSPELLEKLLLTIPEKEDIQVIVVDDNSTKETEEYAAVVEKYSRRAEFYKNIRGGQSAGTCRNIGLDHAEGTWVMFADADDYFMPGMYESVSRYFDSDYEMVIFCPTSVFLDTGETADRHIADSARIHQYLANPTDENLLSVKKMKGPWSKIIRRDIIEKNGLRFSPTLHSNDMYFVFMAFYYCQNMAVIGDVIYCITRNQGSLTMKVTEKAFDLYVQESIKCYRFGTEHYSRRELEQINLNGGVLLFQAYKRRLGLKKIIATWKLLKKNHIPLLSKQMRNPKYLLKQLLISNKMMNNNEKYYIRS